MADGFSFRHQNMPLSTDYESFQQAMAQHAAAVSAANNSSFHSAMAQIPTALNLSVSSANQGYTPGMAASLGNSNAPYHSSYSGSVVSSRSGGKSKNKKPKLNKDGIPPPKRATTAYIHFTQWYREELKNSGREIPKIGDFGKECAARWNSMNDEEKEPFTDAAGRDRDRYRQEMAIYKPARDANKPKRPGTAFMLFMSDFRKEMAGKEPEGGVAAMAKLGGERWRGMTDEEKQPYIERQLEAKLQYEHNMDEYRRKQNLERQLLNNASLENMGRESPSENFGTAPQSQGQVQPQQAQTQPQVQPQVQQQAQSQVQQVQAASQQVPPPRLQPSPPSGCSTPTSTATASPPAQDLSNSPPQQSGPPSTSSSTGANVAPLPSFSTSLALSHPLSNAHATSLAMSYAQYSLPSLAHAGVLTNYTPAHAHTTNSNRHLPTPNNNTTHNQAHMQDPYRWN